MITEEQARGMMKQLAILRKRIHRSEKDKRRYFDYEAHCIEALKSFVGVRTNKYRRFANYGDLTQDAYESLLKAIRTFKLKDNEGNDKGSFYFWAGLFVNTKLSRSANNHTVIRYPMHIAAKTKPHKTNTIPILFEPGHSPEEACELSEVSSSIETALSSLSNNERELVKMVYGFGGEKPLSITKVCKQKKISRASCMKVLNGALETLRTKIEL